MSSKLNAILRLEVPVIVRIAERSMGLSDVLNLVPGSIIEMNKSVEEDLDLLVNNKVIGRGVAVKVGENFGLKVTRLGTQQQRVDALGGRASGAGGTVSGGGEGAGQGVAAPGAEGATPAPLPHPAAGAAAHGAAA
ncbi:MAG: FliM/FliN family flagellar motor switch protein [Phycisphaeraceae bacterium]|nr:FliM/FliN family flagellar motor switch protein [Phycisphaerales bacterium]QOJ16730.1 MAG: FliM/FliN family flagellar motor switch protein [Phycisphaeraceae bacterium]